MQNDQLNLRRKYCDNTGVHLRSDEKYLLCRVLGDPSRYDGFISEMKESVVEDRDYRDTWVSKHQWQYRINIDSQLSIDVRSKHSCDGIVQDQYWDWAHASHVTDLRRILEILKEIEPEL